MGAFFQELTPEIKVTEDDNSERHSITTTYIHKLNLGVNMAYNMRHALTGLAQTWKNLALVLEKSAFSDSQIYPLNSLRSQGSFLENAPLYKC